MEPLTLSPVGIIHSEHTEPGRTPIQPVCALANAVSGARPLRVVPFLDDLPHGIFATRSPIRPNPIGLSIVRLVERRGRELLVEDVDVLDGTPLLDIKPYVEGFDLRVGTRGGWTERVSGDEFVQRGERRPDGGRA